MAADEGHARRFFISLLSPRIKHLSRDWDDALERGENPLPLGEKRAGRAAPW